MRTKNKDYKTNEILQAAIKLFTKKGYDATSIEDICKAAGCSHGKVFYYFKSKEHILYTAILNRLEALNAAIQIKIQDPPISPAEELKLYIQNSLNFVIYFRAIGFPAYEAWRRNLTAEHKKHIMELRSTVDSILINILIRGVKEGVFRQDLNVKMTNYYISVVLLNTKVWFSPKGKMSVADLADDIFNAFFEGIRSKELAN